MSTRTSEFLCITESHKLWVPQSFSLLSMLECQLFLPELRQSLSFPNPPSPSFPSVPGAKLHAFLDIPLYEHDKGSAEGARGSLAQGALATMPQINLILSYFGGGAGRKILNSFFFPANCSHLLSQFWLDSPFPLSSASTARLSPPHPSPPSPRTSKVITIMN